MESDHFPDPKYPHLNEPFMESGGGNFWFTFYKTSERMPDPNVPILILDCGKDWYIGYLTDNGQWKDDNGHTYWKTEEIIVWSYLLEGHMMFEHLKIFEKAVKKIDEHNTQDEHQDDLPTDTNPRGDQK